MGLVFPVHPDLRRSKGGKLLLSSSTKKFSVGGTFLFIGLVLVAMHLATGPLFMKMWEQGALFDQALVVFFYGIIFLYPIVALFCVSFKETVLLTKNEDDSLHIESKIHFGPFKFKQKSHAIESISQLSISNWRGKLNMAALEPDDDRLKAQYATKGHWVLHPENHPDWVLERRAKKEDLDWLKGQIEAYFAL